MTESIKKIPPNSLEAEQCVIGSMIMDPDAIIVANDLIASEDFYHPEYKIIYESIINLYMSDKPVDIVTIQDDLKIKNQLEQVGSIEKIGKVALAVPTSAHVEEYAKIVKEKAYLRKSIKFANEILGQAYNQDYSKTLQTFNDVPSVESNKVKHMSIEQILQQGVNDIATRRKADDDTRGLRTGFKMLDYKTSGLKDGEIIGLKAEPNVGKSILAINIATKVAKRGDEVAFFAYEMSNKQLAYRIMPGEFKIDIHTLTHPKTNLKQENGKTIQEYTPRKLKSLHIFADELEHHTTAEIESKVRLLPNLKLIIIDYLHLMQLDSAVKNDIDKYTVICRSLKKLAQKYNIPILTILSETKDGSVRGTNELQHDLDQIWELKREKDAKLKSDREAAELLLLKGRDNALGKIKLNYYEDYLMFGSGE